MNCIECEMPTETEVCERCERRFGRALFFRIGLPILGKYTLQIILLATILWIIMHIGR